MPSPRPGQASRTAPNHERLSLFVDDLRIKAYVEAVREHLESRLVGEVRGLRNTLAEHHARLTELQADNASLKERLASAEATLASFTDPSGDDKYALTKAKLIQFMKAQGWY